MGSLQFLQVELQKLWTDEKYSEQFKASEVKHKDFEHALGHIVKATGKLFAMVDDGAHSGGVTCFSKPEVEKYLADLVICTLRLANTAPLGALDLERAVFDRIERKMGVRLVLGER